MMQSLLSSIFKLNKSANEQTTTTLNNNYETIDHPYDPTLKLCIYHEKQMKEMCALHALNNLFQERFFTKKLLDDLSNALCAEQSSDSWINPNKSVLGTGNYNVSVIMRAVQLKDHECVWFNKNKYNNDSRHISM